MSSKSFPGLIPGLESFMEDTDVSVEVSVGEPEEVEASEEAVEAGAEIAEVSEEAESTEEQTEMILLQFEDLAHRYEHVKKYGVDRTFMRLFNANGELSKALRHSFPSCESFDATGSATSAESIACMEGLGDALKSVWDFVKNLCKKIAAFFARLFEAVRVRLGDLNKQIGRLRKLDKERTSDADGLSDVDKKIVSVKALNDIKSNIEKKIIAGPNGEVAIKSSKKIVAFSDLVKSINGSDEAKIKQYNEDLKEYKKEFDDFKREMRKVFDDPDMMEVGKVPSSDIAAYLNLADAAMTSVDVINKKASEQKTDLANVERLAANKASRAADANDAKTDRDAASSLSRKLNLASGQTAFAIEVYQKLASMAVRAASARLQYRKKAA